ncbi:MAG: hypothetical protein EKK41_21625 [Hyphomicrobiales bacterium]|nr:MAG: hypothetical protein EKK41_21625 [Hyphomicrobiales bacterium]
MTSTQEVLSQSSGLGPVSAGFDGKVFEHVKALRARYGLRPGVAFYDDGSQPNALALNELLLTDGEWGGTDGTVLLGRHLLFTLWRDGTASLLRRSQRSDGRLLQENDLDILVVVAHEFGHILQYKSGMSPDGPWQMEPHADFLAGWAIDKTWLDGLFSDKDASFDSAIRLIFSLGDTEFNSPYHHGTPDMRSAMVRAGQEFRHLDVRAAFTKGLELAGLR